MNILSWDARGLKNPLSVRSLVRVVNVQVLELIFLVESRLEKKKRMQSKGK